MALVIGCLMAANAFAAGETETKKETVEAPRFSAGWLLFGDLYHLPSHHLPEGDGATGLVIRRGYLTFDADFDDSWFGRLRFELNQSGAFETYDLELDVKDLYIGRRFGRHTGIFGLSPTPTFDVIESFWGKRYLMRTPMDLQGVASRDSGLAFRGPVSTDGSLSYRTMLGAGIEFGAESGDGRKLMGALNWKPSEHWELDFYIDHEKLAGNTDRTTLQAFAGYRQDAWRFGFQYSNQDRQEDPPLELASAFLISDLSPRLSFIGRVDRIIEPSPRGDNIAYIPFDPNAPATMLVGGLEFQLSERVMITPNVIHIRYDRAADNTRAKDDLYLRLTAFFNFE